MSKQRRILVSVALILLIGVLSIPIAPLRQVSASGPAHRTFHLIGFAALNWNSTTPGPLMTVFDGDLVSILFSSGDGLIHTWYLDVNNNGIADPGEPNSFPIEATSSTFVNFTFTPKIGTNIPAGGNFTYRCGVHPGSMFGAFQVIPATINSSINSASTLDSKSVATVGTLTVDMRSLTLTGSLTVTATNSTTGATLFSKTYTIPTIGLMPISSSSRQVLFGLNVQVLLYALSVEVKVILQGITVTSSTLLTRELDINGNGSVDIIDAGIAALAFGSSVGNPKYNPQADFLAHGTIDIVELGVFAFYFNAQILH
jgi:hypothetical protein